MTKSQPVAADCLEEWLGDMYSSTLEAVVNEYRQRQPGQVQSWPVADFAALSKVHHEFVELGFVRSEKLLERLIERLIQNVFRLHANNVLMEHEEIGLEEALSDYGMSAGEMDDFPDWITDGDGHWRISDYAIKPLINLAVELYREPSCEQRLVLVNRLLNVVHQRSDLAAWFVEGGLPALSELSETPTPSL